ATVDEAHVIINDRTNNRQLYVAATRGRRANHIHTAPPAFDPDQHGPASDHEDWLPRDAVAAALNRQPDATSAIARRRHLRDLVNGAVEQTRGPGQRRRGPGPDEHPLLPGGRSRRATPTHEHRAERPVAQPIDASPERGPEREIM